jgi:hypothetical protein
VSPGHLGPRKYWAVKLWWYENGDRRGSLCEAGGHFSWNEGDKWWLVLEAVIQSRRAPREHLVSVEITLEDLDR